MNAMSGVWLLPSDAAKHLGLPFDNERQFKRDSELDVLRNVERCAQCSSTASIFQPFHHYIVQSLYLSVNLSTFLLFNLSVFLSFYL